MTNSYIELDAIPDDQKHSIIKTCLANKDFTNLFAKRLCFLMYKHHFDIIITLINEELNNVFVIDETQSLQQNYQKIKHQFNLIMTFFECHTSNMCKSHLFGKLMMQAISKHQSMLAQLCKDNLMITNYIEIIIHANKTTIYKILDDSNKSMLNNIFNIFIGQIKCNIFQFVCDFIVNNCLTYDILIFFIKQNSHCLTDIFCHNLFMLFSQKHINSWMHYELSLFFILFFQLKLEKCSNMLIFNSNCCFDDNNVIVNTKIVSNNLSKTYLLKSCLFHKNLQFFIDETRNKLSVKTSAQIFVNQNSLIAFTIYFNECFINFTTSLLHASIIMYLCDHNYKINIVQLANLHKIHHCSELFFYIAELIEHNVCVFNKTTKNIEFNHNYLIKNGKSNNIAIQINPNIHNNNNTDSIWKQMPEFAYEATTIHESELIAKYNSKLHIFRQINDLFVTCIANCVQVV